jgi:hypothetical protein
MNFGMNGAWRPDGTKREEAGATPRKLGVHSVPLEVKNCYESNPLLIYPPGHDYITVWRKADQPEFFVAGKYLHVVQVGGKVVALAYSELTKEEVDLVEQHIRVVMKVQNPVIKYYRD